MCSGVQPRFPSPPPDAGARQRVAEAVSNQELRAQVNAYLTRRQSSNPKPNEIREARAEAFASFPWMVDLYISLAFAAYRAARELGLCIPEDLSVVGYDDHQLAVLVGPGLTTLAWDAVIEAAVGQLAASGTQSAPFRPELIVRGSTNEPGRPA